MNVAYGCCVGSWDKLHQYVVPHLGDRPLLALSGQTSISVAYNAMLDVFSDHDLDMVILQHDDLELTDRTFEVKFLTALEPDVAIVGVAGGYDVRSLAWWEANTVGHQLTDSGLLKFSTPFGDVQSLEGSVMAFSPWAIKHLRFDEDFIGFHGYDDIGMVARAFGKRVVVADIDTHHHTTTGFKSPASAEAWAKANDRFVWKWGL